ncbi:Uncharacterised protein [Enterobacter ludwigii]|nr:Uncharacterised protein [Enterobacter ludwigii]
MADSSPPDGGRDQADQQRHQDGGGDRGTAVSGEWPQRGGCQQKDNCQRHQQDGQGNFVWCFTTLRAFHHGNHAVKEGFTRVDATLDHQPVGENARPARYGGEITPGFTYDGSGFPGDSTFIYRRAAFDDFTVAGDNVPGFDQHHVTFTQFICRDMVHLGTVFRFA